MMTKRRLHGGAVARRGEAEATRHGRHGRCHFGDHLARTPLTPRLRRKFAGGNISFAISQAAAAQRQAELLVGRSEFLYATSKGRNA